MSENKSWRKVCGGLPALPVGEYRSAPGRPELFTASQMQRYAQAALAEQQADHIPDAAKMVAEQAREIERLKRSAQTNWNEFAGGLKAQPSGVVDDRAEFEAWYRDNWGWPESYVFAIDKRGQYEATHPQEQWAVWQARAALTAQPDHSAHPDDVAVDQFAAAMKAKMAKSRDKGRHGWQNATAPHLSSLLYEHMYKGDPLDVANLSMMLHQNGQAVELPHEARRNPDHSAQSCVAPDGYVLVRKTMMLDAAALEALVFVGGGLYDEMGKPTYLDCVMWVGDLQDDDGKMIHGLHVYCTECEEEGSTTLAEFATPAPGKEIE